jgi:hypothetical protein
MTDCPLEASPQSLLGGGPFRSPRSRKPTIATESIAADIAAAGPPLCVVVIDDIDELVSVPPKPQFGITPPVTGETGRIRHRGVRIEPGDVVAARIADVLPRRGGAKLGGRAKRPSEVKENRVLRAARSRRENLLVYLGTVGSLPSVVPLAPAAARESESGNQHEKNGPHIR